MEISLWKISVSICVDFSSENGQVREKFGFVYNAPNTCASRDGVKKATGVRNSAALALCGKKI